MHRDQPRTADSAPAADGETRPGASAAAPVDLLAPAVARFVTVHRPLAEVIAADSSRDVALVALLEHEAGAAARSTRGSLAALSDVGVDVEALRATHDPQGSAGAVSTIPRAPGQGPRVIHVVGLGAGRPEDLRAAGAALGRVTRGRSLVVVALPPALAPDGLAALVEGVVLGQWTPPRFRAEGPVTPSPPAGTIVLLRSTTARVASAADPGDRGPAAGPHRPDDERAVVERAVVRARAALLARTLGAVPSNLKNPAWLAAQSRTLARRHGLGVRVRNDKVLAREGFGGLTSVGAGSATPPRLVELTWTPPTADDATRHVVLVGKGITFDTGGLDIKPTDAMLGMKTDMMGAAVVLAVLAACRDLGVRVRVTGLLALAENAVSGSSQRPGDVVAHYGGRTVEIGNTDAEGRIVLADALAYAVSHLHPDAVIDIATLTGAARVAFARTMAPVFATDDELADALVTAGVASGETLWPLPLPSAYRAALDSDVADLKQFSSEHGAGSIMAALFLREFVGAVPWAHLDVAGPGRSDVDAGLLAKGPTGFGARLLLTLLEGLS